MDQYFTIYGQENCNACQRVKSLLEMRGYKYDYLDIAKHMDEFEFDFPNAKSVPKIVLEDWVNIKFESYEELKEYLDEQRNRIDVA